jgi:hypothetical protein
MKVRSLSFNKVQTLRGNEQQTGISGDIMEIATPGAASTGGATPKKASVSEPPAMQIIGCLNDDGLGNIDWWR